MPAYDWDQPAKNRSSIQGVMKGGRGSTEVTCTKYTRGMLGGDRENVSVNYIIQGLGYTPHQYFLLDDFLFRMLDTCRVINIGGFRNKYDQSVFLYA